MSKKLYATFVLPAPHGCNLHCPYCVIDQRKEAVAPTLADDDFVYFLTDTLVGLPVTRFGIQGFEPLLPEVWPLTKRLLGVAGAFFCETSLVTNGTYLARYAKELGGFPGLVDSVTVSLDGARAEVHDKLRGKTGAHKDAVEGLRVLRQNFRGTVAVNSVLFPNRVSFLAEMPQLLNTLGVREWIISPFINLERETPVAQSAQLKDDMLTLCHTAEASGIRVLLSDELRLMEGDDLFKDFYVRSLESDEEIFRLSPDGSCSRGREILGVVGEAPVWNKAEKPAVFLERVFKETGVSLQSRNSITRGLARWHARRISKERR
ncbi:MAG TPA: radical SAM protein [Candidatus Paceibacterota bacterium]|nr:radical SAM protein [Candidatus Paceibacterota bacterium]